MSVSAGWSRRHNTRRFVMMYDHIPLPKILAILELIIKALVIILTR